jgi:hypothetical protein
MEPRRQPTATDGNGFRLFARFASLVDLPLIAAAVKLRPYSG